jgi:type I restriction enzyme M protein
MGPGPIHPVAPSSPKRPSVIDRLRRFPTDPERDRWNQEHFRYFDFDLLMTNPPFAGDIRERQILRDYELAHKGKDRLPANAKQGRDILFIERDLEFLKPGGRMAIVLPQGRFNNTTDAYIREFIARECRILAVVGLDVNTFKPHTGTKTSVLFVQKWNDDPQAGPLCPQVDDYPIFFATSKKSGKNNSGNYVYQTAEDGSRRLDEHGHLVVDHDLDEIAAAFVLFAREQGLSFWQDTKDPKGLQDPWGLGPF